jgi:hypothetical protein
MDYNHHPRLDNQFAINRVFDTGYFKILGLIMSLAHVDQEIAPMSAALHGISQLSFPQISK